jgi:TolA-binding protein
MNMSCKKAEDYLVDYLYQELSAKKTLEIEKHLHGCVNCRSTLESWRAIHRAYQRTSEEPLVSPFTKQKLLAVAEEELRRPASWSERLQWALKIATVPIAIFVIVLFLNREKTADMAMQKAAPKAVAPEMQPEEKVAKQPGRLEGLAGAKPSAEYTEKRRDERSVFTDELSARPKDEKYDRDFAAKEQDPIGSAASDMVEPEPSAPAAASPMPLEEEAGQETDQNEAFARQAPPMKTSKVTAITQTADEPFQQAQQEIQRDNLKKGKELLTEAVRSDDKKSLAGQLHQEGNSYQNKGEYGKAIMNFQQVQVNYRDYPRLDEVLLRLGDSYAELGQFDKAVQTYQQVSPAQRDVASQRIQQLQKKQEARKQLESLGYVTTDKN